jgi:hypothetical protein
MKLMVKAASWRPFKEPFCYYFLSSLSPLENEEKTGEDLPYTKFLVLGLTINQLIGAPSNILEENIYRLKR